MENVTDIITAMGGRKHVAAYLDLTVDAVRMAEYSGKLPAMWYDALERKLGEPLPRHLFTFRAGT